MRPPIHQLTRGSAWSVEEAEATVATYLQMLTLQLNSQRYSKTEFRNSLIRKLNNRSPSAVEMKFQNISQVMLEQGWPHVAGYLPRKNYQAILYGIVGAQAAANEPLKQAAQKAVTSPAVLPNGIKFSKVLQAPPKKGDRVERTEVDYTPDSRVYVRDYLAQEAANRALGLAGEKFVLEFEHYRLYAAGEKKLADKIEHVSVTKGDSLGYDILSFDASGKERLIEVKTTSFSAETPFYVSRNEVRVAEANPGHYRVCRVYDFRQEPRLYEVTGRFDQHFLLDPVTYTARRC